MTGFEIYLLSVVLALICVILHIMMYPIGSITEIKFTRYFISRLSLKRLIGGICWTICGGFAVFYFILNTLHNIWGASTNKDWGSPLFKFVKNNHEVKR